MDLDARRLTMWPYQLQPKDDSQHDYIYGKRYGDESSKYALFWNRAGGYTIIDLDMDDKYTQSQHQVCPAEFPMIVNTQEFLQHGHTVDAQVERDYNANFVLKCSEIAYSYALDFWNRELSSIEWVTWSSYSYFDKKRPENHLGNCFICGRVGYALQPCQECSPYTTCTRRGKHRFVYRFNNNRAINPVWLSIILGHTFDDSGKTDDALEFKARGQNRSIGADLAI